MPASERLIWATVPVSVTVPVPLVVTVAPPAMPALPPLVPLPIATVPAAAVNVVLTVFAEPASTSPIDRPVILNAVLECTVISPGTPLLIGASLTAVTETLTFAEPRLFAAAPSFASIVNARAVVFGFSLVLLN